MRPSILSWVCSVLALHSVSSADEPPSFTDLPNEIQLAILQQFFVSQKFDFCGYVDWLAVNRWAYHHMEVGLPMLKEIVEEERSLNWENDKQRARKQQILKTVGALVRIHSIRPIVCKTTDTNELEQLAQVFDSTYRDFSSFSESPTWKRACMAGLFGRNTLIKILPHLSDDFCSESKEILLQTAFFVGDIDLLQAIVDFFRLSESEVLNTVSELDIVFSGSVDFFDELVKFLPSLMEKRWHLIEEASSLKRLGILTRLLEEVKGHEMNSMLDSFLRLKIYDSDSIARLSNTEDKLYFVLKAAAQHGHLPIILFLWPAMKKGRYLLDSRLLKSVMGTISTKVKDTIKSMMIRAAANNDRSVLEFLMWESGGYYLEVAQLYVKAAFKAAVGGGHIQILKFLVGKRKNNKPVAPGLRLTKLSWMTLRQAILINRKWNGIKYLVFLKRVDPRFADFELVDQGNTALCMACAAGSSEGVKYLLRKTLSGGFVFPLTNPAADNNRPLITACSSGNLWIVEKLLERDEAGNYVYEGIDPSVQDYRSIFNACEKGHVKVLEFLLKMNDAREYVLPKMKDVAITCGLLFAVKENQIKVLRVLLKMENGKYVLPGMKGVNFTTVLLDAIGWKRVEVVRFILEMKEGRYVFPGMNSVDFDRVLLAAIEWYQRDIVKFLLRIEDGKYVLPEMAGVNLNTILSTAINWNKTDVLRLLLSQDLDGSYLYPGIRVTEDMLRIQGQGPEIRALLESRLEQQRIRVEELFVA